MYTRGHCGFFRNGKPLAKVHEKRTHYWLRPHCMVEAESVGAWATRAHFALVLTILRRTKGSVHRPCPQAPLSAQTSSSRSVAAIIVCLEIFYLKIKGHDNHFKPKLNFLLRDVGFTLPDRLSHTAGLVLRVQCHHRRAGATTHRPVSSLQGMPHAATSQDHALF